MNAQRPMHLRWVVVLLALLASVLPAVSGCVKPPHPPDYGLYKKADPRSVLIVPVMNNSSEVGAEDYFLATITVPLAERGYYVFPVNLTRELLADVGLSDPGLVRSAEVQKIAALFGADAVLFVTITHWEAKYLVLSTTVTVGFEYVLKSGKSGETLWSTSQTMNYSPHAQSSGNPIADLVVMAVEAAVTKAMPNYMPLARQANWRAIAATDVGTGQALKTSFPILYGPYHPKYRQDW